MTIKEYIKKQRLIRSAGPVADSWRSTPLADLPADEQQQLHEFDFYSNHTGSLWVIVHRTRQRFRIHRNDLIGYSSPWIDLTENFKTASLKV